MPIRAAYLGLAFLGALSLTAPAQNLLVDNPAFEELTGYYTPGWGYPQGAPDVIPGWVISLDPAGDGYAGAADNQSPEDLEGRNFGYLYSGYGAEGVMETAPESRAPVEAGTTYTLWFLARGDAPWEEASVSVALVWYANSNNYAIKGDAVTLSFTLGARQSTLDPMQSFHLTAVAPPGAHYAAVRVTRPAYNYAPVIFDDFVIMAEPDQVNLSIERKHSDVKISWNRSVKYELQETTDPAATNNWQKVTKAVKGVGSTNLLDYPLDQAVRFFRLTGVH